MTIPDKMVVIRKGHDVYEVWAMEVWWSGSVKGYVYTDIYDRLIATFKSGFKAKQYAAALTPGDTDAST